MKRICLIATGGTIACVQTEQGFVPGLSGRDLLARVPDLGDVAAIDVQQIMNIDSSEMQVSDWRSIARAVFGAAEAYDGVVITHGTDTMCYTAAALSFMLSDLRIPVVLTGAQRPLLLEDSDAVNNLRDACAVAVYGEAGVSIVFNPKIIHGSRAFKMNSKNDDAYVSRNYPYLGKIENGQVIWQHHAKIQRGQPRLFVSLNENVALLKLTPASNPSALDYVAKYGFSGVVIEGFGTGGIANLNRGMAQGIRRLTEERRMPVLMISQCPYDGVNLAVYGIGEQAAKAGVIPGNDMTTETAVVKLMWALGKTQNMSEIAGLLESNICDEITGERKIQPAD